MAVMTDAGRKALEELAADEFIRARVAGLNRLNDLSTEILRAQAVVRAVELADVEIGSLLGGPDGVEAARAEARGRVADLQALHARLRAEHEHEMDMWGRTADAAREDAL